MADVSTNPVKKRRFTIIDDKIVKAKLPSTQKQVQLPALKTSKKKNPRDQLSRNILQQLSKAYPQAFNLKVRKPLIVGVKEALLDWANEQAIDIKDLSYALGYYVRGASYLRAVLKYDQRVNLQGEPVGEITKEHKVNAKEMLEHLLAKRKKKEPVEK